MCSDNTHTLLKIKHAVINHASKKCVFNITYERFDIASIFSKYINLKIKNSSRVM